MPPFQSILAALSPSGKNWTRLHRCWMVTEERDNSRTPPNYIGNYPANANQLLLLSVIRTEHPKTILMEITLLLLSIENYIFSLMGNRDYRQKHFLGVIWTTMKHFSKSMIKKNSSTASSRPLTCLLTSP